MRCRCQCGFATARFPLSGATEASWPRRVRRTCGSATATQGALDRTERDLAATARNQGAVYEARRFAVVAGQRRALVFTETPLDGAGVVGSAIDVTDVATAEAKLQQHIDAHADTLDKLATAVAIFGRDQRLTFYNQAFVRLWDLPEKWLEGHPSDGEMLDRLREGRKLPEQRDYQAWKRERLAHYENQREFPTEEPWHLPAAKTLRVVAQPHPFGGLTYLYEDITEKLALESAFNTQIKVQSATLDTLQEAVAVFGPDGKLKLHNAAFLKIWELSRKDVEGEPHIRTIAAACADKFGDEAVWERLIQSIVSGAPTRRDWGEIERNDPHDPVADPVGAAGRRDARHLCGRHRPLADRERAARAQRGPRGGRQPEIRFHQACVLRIAYAAEYHLGFRRTSCKWHPGRAQPRPGRLCAGHRGRIEHAQGPDQ